MVSEVSAVPKWNRGCVLSFCHGRCTPEVQNHRAFASLFRGEGGGRFHLIGVVVSFIQERRVCEKEGQNFGQW